MTLNNQGPLTDADITQFDKPLGDSDIAMFDAGVQGAAPKPPVDPRNAIEQEFQGKRQRLDKVYQGMAKANKIASYGVPAGVLTDQQQARYNQELGNIQQARQAALASVPPPPVPAPMPMADGGTVTAQDLRGGTFGMAQERHTRAPIMWDDLKGDEGLYNGPGLASALQAGIKTPSAAVPAYQRGVIHVDPNAPDGNLPRDLRHEALHQVLMGQNDWQQSEKAAIAPPDYGPIARKTMIRRGGSMVDEVPAYMGSYDWPQTTVMPEQRQTYVNDFLKNLANINPQGAAQYGRIANLPPVPQFANGGAVSGGDAQPFAKGGKVHRGPMPALIGEAGNELLVHQNGSQELIDHPQIRQLGTTGTDQVVPLTRPGGKPETLRGSSSVSLDQSGTQMAQERANEYAGQFDRISASPFVRAMQSAQPMIQSNPQATFTPEPGLSDMGLGALEGQQVTDGAIQQLNHMVLRAPDMPFSGQGQTSTAPGDSFNGFKNRVIGGLHGMMQRHAASGFKSREAGWTHNRVLRVTKGWAHKGFNAQGNVDTEPLVNYNKNATPPGGTEHLGMGVNGKWKLTPVTKPPAKGPDGKIPPGIYLFRHGSTAYNQKS